MTSRFFACGLALAAVVTLPGCQQEPSVTAHQAPIPAPDLCRSLDRALVRTAMQGKVTGCDVERGPDSHVVEFVGTATVGKVTVPAVLTVSYQRRLDLKTGVDLWQAEGAAKGSRVALIGVGDAAAFDPQHAPQLVTLRRGVVVAVGLQLDGAAVPQDQLPDHLLGIARLAVQAIG
jgi:hypothetical protein